LLALQAPLDAARELRTLLVDDASETKDHVLSDEVWAIVRQRISASYVSGGGQQSARKRPLTDRALFIRLVGKTDEFSFSNKPG
jgi:hypothetical protein